MQCVLLCGVCHCCVLHKCVTCIIVCHCSVIVSYVLKCVTVRVVVKEHVQPFSKEYC